MRKIKLVFALLISVLVISTCFTTLAFAEENDTTYIYYYYVDNEYIVII